MEMHYEADIFERVIRRQIHIEEAARICGYTKRTAYRRLKRYKQEGLKGLRHGLVGKTSNRAKDPSTRTAVIDFYRERGDGKSLSAFVRHFRTISGISVCRETVRQWLLDAGLWQVSERPIMASGAPLEISIDIQAKERLVS